MFTGEMVEEIFEQLIEAGLAGGIAWIFSNAITNTIFIFMLVQGSKVTVKQVTKIMIIFIKPFIKKIIYKEGNDKVEAIKKFITLFKNEIATNPKALTGLGVNGLVDSVVGMFTYILTMSADMPEAARVAIAVLVPLALCVFMTYLLIKYVHEVPKDKDAREAEKKLKAERAANDKLTREAIAEQKKLDAEAADRIKKQEHDNLVKLRMQELQAAKDQEAAQ